MITPASDGWVELRDDRGHLWGWYSPSEDAVRFERRKGKGAVRRAIISLKPNRR